MAVLAAVIVASGFAACATTPPPLPANADIAYRELQQAVRTRQHGELWRVLDRRTHATWQIAWRARRAAYELMPLLDREMIANDRELRALPAAPPVRVEDMFNASIGEADWAQLAAQFDPAARVIELGADAQALSPTGDRLAFRKASDGTWGFADLGELARQAAQRELALVDRLARLLEMVTPGLPPGSLPWR